MKKTKKRIIETTINLFNQYGFANVRLPQIADTLKISLGNLTYHFPRKDQLIEAVYKTFQRELALVTRDFEELPDLNGMNEQVRAFYDLQQRFRFFYLDLLEVERAYPNIAKAHYEHVETQIDGIYKALLYNVHIGKLTKYPPDVYKDLALQFWTCVVFWPTQLAVRGKTGTIDDMIRVVWRLVQPYATSNGIIDFQDIFKTKKIN